MVATESDSELERGDAAPAFELPGTDGETYALDSFETDALLVVFTCNHCPYAKAKFDLLNELAAEYDDLAVVGINPNDAEAYPEDAAAVMREYVSEGTIAYDAYLRDETATVAAAYGAVCTPDPVSVRPRRRRVAAPVPRSARRRVESGRGGDGVLHPRRGRRGVLGRVGRPPRPPLAGVFDQVARRSACLSGSTTRVRATEPTTPERSGATTGFKCQPHESTVCR
ncbi:MAG: peroxiredoxin [uncultured archaeon A07HR67]|nr:MAG: peroxiredoxin [uncultured archaeon A07HR67]